MKTKKKTVKKKEDQSKDVGLIFNDLMKPKEIVEVVKGIDKYKEQGTTISIDKLPECPHKTKLLKEVTDITSKICVVASFNQQSNKWSCYAGYPDIRDLKPLNGTEGQSTARMDLEWSCEYVRNREQVLFLGDKLNEETARILFPDWKELEYE